MTSFNGGAGEGGPVHDGGANLEAVKVLVQPVNDSLETMAPAGRRQRHPGISGMA